MENIEVNSGEIEQFLPDIYQKLEDLTREELIQKFVSMEFNTFLSYYENAPDLNDLSARENARGRSRNENMARFFINLGRKDRLNPSKLIGIINDQEIGDKVEIGAIDILDTFSFFEIDKSFEAQTLSCFLENKPDFNGRTVNVEVTKTDRDGGGKKRRRGNFSNGSSGGRRRRGDGSSKASAGFGRRRRKG